MADYQHLIQRLKQQYIEGEQPEVSKWSQNYLKKFSKRYFFELGLLEKVRRKEDVKLLEIGSAPFQMTWLLAQLDYEVTGVDIDPDRFRSFIKNNGLTILPCNIDVDKIPVETDSFDIALFMEVFEHLRINPINSLREINRVLKPGGILVLSTPNLNSFVSRTKVFIGKGFDQPFDEFNKLNTIGHMGHIREYTPSQVKVFLEKTGFKPVQVVYPYYKRKVNPLSTKAVSQFVYRLFPPLRSHFIWISEKTR